jgi:hypothetical protein
LLVRKRKIVKKKSGNMDKETAEIIISMVYPIATAATIFVLMRFNSYIRDILVKSTFKPFLIRKHKFNDKLSNLLAVLGLIFVVTSMIIYIIDSETDPPPNNLIIVDIEDTLITNDSVSKRAVKHLNDLIKKFNAKLVMCPYGKVNTIPLAEVLFESMKVEGEVIAVVQRLKAPFTANEELHYFLKELPLSDYNGAVLLKNKPIKFLSRIWVAMDERGLNIGSKSIASDILDEQRVKEIKFKELSSWNLGTTTETNFGGLKILPEQLNL